MGQKGQASGSKGKSLLKTISSWNELILKELKRGRNLPISQTEEAPQKRRGVKQGRKSKGSRG